MIALFALTSYGTFIGMLLISFCLVPVQALAFQATNYARVVAQAERIAYLAAQKPSLSTAVASAAMATNPTSLAVRLVTGPVGWAALGVSAGLIIAQMYYSGSDLSALKQAATPAGGTSITHPNTGTFTVPSAAYNGQNATFSTTIGSPCAGDGNTYDWMIGPFNVQYAFQLPQVGTSRGGPYAFYVCHIAGGAGSYNQQSGTVTQADVEAYVETLPASDPQSVESHTQPAGLGQPTPAGGQTTNTQTVSPTEMPTTVKPKPVPAGDSVVQDNVPPPPGSPQQATQQQTATTTTTTTQNPNGSVTEQEQTQATVSCSTGDHEPRTFASVLQEHQAKWTSSGLLGAVNLLKTLVWPSGLPVISLPSSFFGQQSVNFNDWAWAFTAIRTLMIAIATLAAYRIIFVGGR